MKFNYRKLFMFSLFSLVMMMQACDNSNDPNSGKPGAEGFFIVNEGNFGSGNTSISYYDQATGVVTNEVFTKANGRPLGDQAQSMTVFEGRGYIVVQGSGKIEVIDSDEFTSIATITDDIEGPRYFLGISATKAYVSDWGADGLAGTVKVLDLITNTVTKTIATGQGANQMLKKGDKVYVANSGGFGHDNTIKVIDIGTDAVTGSVTVGDNPNSLVTDADGNIWVTSSGRTAYNDDWTVDEDSSTPGSLSKITSGTTESLHLDAGALGEMKNLNISPDGTTLYYTYNGNVYRTNTSSATLPTTPFKDKNYYGLAVNPFNGEIIGCAAPNFSSAGTIEVMNESGAVLHTYTVGIAPNGCAFK